MDWGGDVNRVDGFVVGFGLVDVGAEIGAAVCIAYHSVGLIDDIVDGNTDGMWDLDMAVGIADC